MGGRSSSQKVNVALILRASKSWTLIFPSLEFSYNVGAQNFVMTLIDATPVSRMSRADHRAALEML